ncbi:hypothetical protein TL16_g06151 [Triparma laevis f. inornata]|uniref:Uncharacterized protein n=2 Tax=Triparma laevis TaxID=1534972 RepID=A0A9W7E556_9STRA|nr:hypothetical protein TrLO_g1061 [Triparma laevis f. longispina]GMH73306.1 hypothetical protein TL16_g06151 [Triparma laevis f. inornata]
MHTPEFRIHFVDYVPDNMLMALRSTTKAWRALAEAFIDKDRESGAIMVHDGKGISWFEVPPDPREERRKLVTLVIFLLNVTKIGEHACHLAANLVVFDIPEGIESIGKFAFVHCKSLTTVSFPTTLTLIRMQAFDSCSSLENVDLLHTNPQEICLPTLLRTKIDDDPGLA